MKVSIWMITYNHEKYIAKAIESVLSQITTFDFELVIGEDCSTDNTRDICISYQRNFPSKVKLLLHKTNIGIHNNIIQTLNACTGKYIALLEGDDYWTDNYKLQKQADFLENNKEYVMCYAKALQIDEISGKQKITNEFDKPTTGIEEILKRGWFMRTGSIVIRNNLIDKFPSWYYKYNSTDYMLQVLIAEHGKVKFLDEVNNVYRRHAGGITQEFQRKNVEFLKAKIRLLDEINNYYQDKYYTYIKINKESVYQLLFVEVLKNFSKFSDFKYFLYLLPRLNHLALIKKSYKYLGKKIVKKENSFFKTY